MPPILDRVSQAIREAQANVPRLRPALPPESLLPPEARGSVTIARVGMPWTARAWDARTPLPVGWTYVTASDAQAARGTILAGTGVVTQQRDTVRVAEAPTRPAVERKPRGPRSERRRRARDKAGGAKPPRPARPARQPRTPRGGRRPRPPRKARAPRAPRPSRGPRPFRSRTAARGGCPAGSVICFGLTGFRCQPAGTPGCQPGACGKLGTRAIQAFLSLLPASWRTDTATCPPGFERTEGLTGFRCLPSGAAARGKRETRAQARKRERIYTLPSEPTPAARAEPEKAPTIAAAPAAGCPAGTTICCGMTGWRCFTPGPACGKCSNRQAAELAALGFF